MGMPSTEHDACAKNSHIRYVRFLQALLVFAAVAAAGTNFYFYTMHSHALPTTSVIYEINPILQNDGIFFSEGDENIWKTENFRDKLFQEAATGLTDAVTGYTLHGLTDVQVVKYALGCYGRRDLGGDEQILTKTSGDNTYDKWSTATDPVKYSMLNQWQYETNKMEGTMNVCSCIDRMYKEALSEDALTAIATAHTTKKGSASLAYADEMPVIADKSEELYWANSLSTTATLAQGKTYLKTYFHDETKKFKLFKQEITDVCISSAMPVQAIAYEETVPASLFLFAGHILLVVSVLQAYYFFVLCRTSSAPSSVSIVMGLKILLWATVLFTVCWGVFNTYKTFTTEEPTVLTYRSPLWNHWRGSPVSLLSIGGLFVFFFITIILEWLLRGAQNSCHHESGQDQLTSAMKSYIWRGSIAEEIIQHVAVDLQLILGFSLCAVGVLAQSDVCSTHSLVGGALIIFVLGLLQHTSNVIKAIYNRVCSRMDKQLVIDLSTSPPNKEPNSIAVDTLETHVRPVLQYFGWTRMWLFLIVVAGTIAFLTVARVSNYPLSLHNMLDGQFLYFAFVFLISSVGFDIFYEIMPFMFEHMHTESLRCYVVLLYVIYFNLNQLVYISRIPMK
jgi:hypothetical protein